MAKVSVKVFPSDVQVSVHRGRSVGGRESVRGRVTEFSVRSQRRLLFAAFNACCDWFAFITLTYPSDFPSSGRICKKHWDTFIKRLKRKYPSVQYLGGFEFQERGAPHFHILVSEFVDLAWLSQAWYEVVESGDLKHLHAGTSVRLVSGRKQGAGYMAKVYTAKRAQKEVPEGFADAGRFWFSSRGLVQAVRETTIEEYSDAVTIVRTLRKFVERSLKPRRRQPARDGVKRKRKVHRKPSLQFLHTGFCGLTAYNGSDVALRLLDNLSAEDGLESENLAAGFADK